jgi:hypothetical protein
MPVLKNRQAGSVLLTSTSIDVTVSTYELNGSVLFFSYRGGDNAPSRSMVMGEKLNTTTLRFTRDAAGGNSPTIEWELLEFDDDVTVQDLSVAENTDCNPEITQSITSVTTGETFIVPMGARNPGTGFGTDDTLRLRLASSTTVGQFCNSNGSPEVRYQVVSYSGATVQRFLRNNQAGTSWSQTISTAATGNTFIVASGAVEGGVGFDDIWRIYQASSTSIAGDRNTNGNGTDLSVEVITTTEVTATKAQRSVPLSTQIDNLTISSVTENVSCSVLCGGTNLWASHGYYGGVTDDFNIACFSVRLTSATNLRLERQTSGQTADVYYQVIEWNATSNTITFDAVSTGSKSGGLTLNFNHTIGSGSNRLLVVGISTRGNNRTDATPTSVTYNGVAMTKAGDYWADAIDTSFAVLTTIYYMLESSLPSTGSYQVSIVTPNNNQAIIAEAVSLANVKQQTPEASGTSRFTGSTTFSELSLTTLTDNAWITDHLATDGGSSTGTAGTGQVERADQHLSNTGGFGSTRPCGTADPYRPNWTLSQQQNRGAHIAFAWAPQAGQVEQMEGDSDGVATVSGTLDVLTDLAAASDGVATVSGTLDVLTILAAVSDGESTVTASLGVRRDLNAQSDGVATVSGSLSVLTDLQGQSDGVASVAGSLSVLTDLQGQSDGVATVSGTLNAALALNAQSDGVASVAASLDVLTDLQAQIDGDATVAGSLEVLTDLAAASNGQASVAGSLEVQTDLTAQSDGAASVSGSLDVLTQLTGQSDGAATVTGTLIETDQLTGQSAGAATVSGSLRVDTDLAATSAGASAVSGALSVRTVLAAQSDGVAAVSAVLSRVRGLLGTSDGEATVAGSLDVLTDLAAQSDGVATVAGSLSVLTDLQGQSDGAASVSGSLDRLKLLDADSDGAATVAGSLSVLTDLQAQSDGVAAVSGSLSVTVDLSATSDGEATVSGSLRRVNILSAVSNGVATVVGSLSVRTELRAQSNGFATVSGSLDVDTPMRSHVDCRAIVSASLSVRTGLQAQSDGVASVAGSLDVRTPLQGQSDGVATVSGTLQVNLKQIEGSSAGVASVAGSLDVLTQLTAQSAGVGFAQARLNVSRIHLRGASDGRARVSGTLSQWEIDSDVEVIDAELHTRTEVITGPRIETDTEVISDASVRSRVKVID